MADNKTYSDLKYNTAEINEAIGKALNSSDKNHSHNEVTNDKNGFMSAEMLKNLTNATEHTKNKNNPHGVTAKQLGVYTTTETDDLLREKADSADVYQKNEVYSKIETERLFDKKSDKNTVANALKRSASGEIIRVDDVSPVEHDLGIKVRSRNVVDINECISKSNNILVNNEDGTYTLTKISEQYRISKIARCFIPANTPYWIDCEVIETSGKVTRPAVQIKFADNSVTSPRYGETKYIEEKDIIGIQVYASTNANDGDYVIFKNFQIVIGDTAPTEYTPYVDPTAVTVTRRGKNIAKPSLTSLTVNGYTVKPNADGTVTVTGAATESVGTSFDIAFRGTEGTRLSANCSYKLTAWKDGVQCSVGAKCVLADGSVEWGFAGVRDYERTITRAYIQFTPEIGDTSKCGTYKVQLECGNATTEYEPYKGATHTPNADGTPNIVSLSPTTTIFTDTEGVIIDLEYNRDINKAFEELCQAIISLGGNI